jgi:hypothetical protein
LVIENEGPRPLFRAKLRRKLGAWASSSLEGRVGVFAQPWGSSATLILSGENRSPQPCATKADVLVAGPLSGVGMDETGTLVVRDFMALRRRRAEQSGRHLVVVLIHHRRKAARSGA